MIQRLAGWWLAVAVVAVLLGATAGTVSAATTRTWTGAGATDNWSEAGNWDSGVPVAGDTLVFPAGASRKTNTNNLAAGLTFDTVRFTGGGYRLQGNAFDVTGELRNEGPSGATNVVEMAVGGAGGVAQVSGRMALTGANTFTGVAAVTGGTLLVTHDSGLGADTVGTTVAAGATLQLSGFTDIGNEPVLLAGAGVGGWGALQSLSGTNYASGVTLSGPVVIGVGQSTLVLDGLDQAGPGASLTLVGGGKLQVDGTGTFAGPVIAEHGNLTWNSATPGTATVLRDGWLRGMGSVGSIDVTAGLVWPGSGSSPGILATTGNAIFNGGRFKVDLDGTVAGSGYGQLTVAGLLSLTTNATLLEIDLGFVPSVGNTFTIIKTLGSGAVQGTFYSLPEGSTFVAGGYTFGISYQGPGGTGNDVVLTVLRQVNADLAAGLSVQPATASPGALLTYTATVTNAGPDRAVSPRVSMGVPAGTTFVSVSAPAGWTCVKPSPSGSSSVSCTGPNLAAGASASITIVVRVNAGRSQPISATVGTFAQTTDQNSVDNSATVVTPVGTPDPRPYKLYAPGVARD
ncbi:MAG: DUF11 domain-containing protein [Dehalococcoidia bacterium]|nr:DUF11 domain-containing protein [Dehalococcoidia bacterium]